MQDSAAAYASTYLNLRKGSKTYGSQLSLYSRSTDSTENSLSLVEVCCVYQTIA
jgi:hypothetical protein